MFAGVAAATGSFAVFAWANSSPWEVYLASATLGTGIGLTFTAMPNLIIENVGPEQTSVATGMNTVLRTVGGAIGGAVVASLLASTVAHGYPTTGGYTSAYVACVAVSVLAVLAGLGVSKRHRVAAVQPPPVGEHDVAEPVA